MLCHVIIRDKDLIGFYLEEADQLNDKIYRNLIAENEDLLVWDKEINMDNSGSSGTTALPVWELFIDGQYYGTYKTLYMACDIACRLEPIVNEGLTITIDPYLEHQALYDQIFTKPMFDEFQGKVMAVMDQLVNIDCSGPCTICPARLPDPKGKISCSLMAARDILRSAIYEKEKEN